MRRAKDGVVEPIFYQGQIVGENRRYSDVLAMFILKSKRREIWGEKKEITAISEFEQLSVEERVRRALGLIGRLKELAAPVIEQPIVYRRDPPKDDEDRDSG